MSEHVDRTLVSGLVPLRRWRVENLKSIREAELEFAPLTLLVGANSSGKTSLLQSILLVVQAAQGDSRGSTFPLNGPLVSVGGFEEVKFAHAKESAFALGGVFDLSPELPPSVAARYPAQGTRPARAATRQLRSTIEWRVAFDGPAVNEPGSAEITSVKTEMVQVAHDQDVVTRLKLSSTRRGQGQIEADVERQRLGSLAFPTREEFALGFTGVLSPPGDAKELPIRGLFLRAGLPHNVVTAWRLGEAAAMVWAETRIYRPFWTASEGPGLPPRAVAGDPSWKMPRGEVADDAAIEQWARVAAEEIAEWDRLRKVEPITLPAFLASTRRPLPPDARRALQDRLDELVEAIGRLLDMDDEVFLPPERTVGGWLGEVMSEVHRFFRQRVVYLGPLRQDPQVVYKTAPVGGAPAFIGTKGEYLATILHASRARGVLNPTEDGSVEPMPLADALDDWARRLGIADSIQTRDLGRLGIQVSVRRGGIPPVDLTSVGVGVSQLLPVIVMCLLARPGSLILLEQPELHLHPALQQRLGDFLLACARSGRQLIVETHSEYVVSRLRRRIAEDDSGEFLSTVAVYFAEQKDDVSEFRRVPVNEFGGIEDWPAGFFDQAAAESRSILEAALEKRDRRGRGAETSISS